MPESAEKRGKRKAASPSPTKGGLPRVVIENVSPVVDGGRHPAKRVAGDPCRVGADIFKDGHDLIAAQVLWRGPGDRGWHAAPMEYRYDPDRWFAHFSVDRPGRWRFAVEAWPDTFGTWQSDLRKRLGAGQEVSSELLDGAELLRLLAERAKGAARRKLGVASARIGDKLLPLEERLDPALSEDLAAAAGIPLDPEDRTRSAVFELIVDRERARFSTWYEMFPRSQSPEPGRHGTFADAGRRLPRLAELGFDVVYLPPIHPIGRSQRKGRGNTSAAQPEDPGSPWAIGSEEGGHTAVHPELGTLSDFEGFVRSAKTLGMEVALDYALQCSPDHPWVREHPEWFFVRPDGTIRHAENPPKKYEDIVPLNFWCEDREALWIACRDIFLFWIERGVRIFRVDNPHTKPFAFWEWVIPEVRESHPDVILLSEAFTRPKRMKALAKLGFTQSYTYFTWKNAAWELREYLSELTQTDMVEYFRPNFFANTPDILHEYLQKGGRPAFRVRLVLAATLSPSYGIYSGFELCESEPARPGSEEYRHSEKYEIRPRDWDAPENINDDVAAINRIRREHPALQRLDNLTFLPSDGEQVLCYRKSAPGDELLIAVNLDPHRVGETMVEVPLAQLGIAPDEPFVVEDLLDGLRHAWRGARNYVRLDPAERVAHVLRVERPGAPASP